VSVTNFSICLASARVVHAVLIASPFSKLLEWAQRRCEQEERVNQDLAVLVAPLTLLLGAGLMAIGLLSLLDVHFFATKGQERAALAAGLALIVATELVFAMSSLSWRFLNGQRADVLECRLEAETNFPEERHKDSLILNDHIIGCMTRYGYEWTPNHDRCKEAPVATNPFCYLPTNGFDRLVTEFQMTFE
jgi:hypothetical protein